MKKKIKFIIFIGIAMYFIYKIYRIFFYTPNISFESMKLQTLNQEKFQFNNNQLNSAIIIFFQTWCKPCIAEMKLIQNHYNELKFTHLYFISDESTDKISALKKRFHLDSLNFLRSEESLVEIGIHTFPSAYIIKNSQTIETHKGTFIDETNIEDEIFHLRKILE